MNEHYYQYLIEGERAGARYALAVPYKVPLGITGIQMGSRSGSSLEFRDHREYQPGDDVRRIDWNAFARTDKLILNLYHEEINPHLDIIIDGSRSMALEDTAKVQATLGLAALLAEAASNSDYSHCAWIVREDCQKVGNGHEKPSIWKDIDFEYCGNPQESFIRLPPAWRQKGIRILLSDLLWLENPRLTLCHLIEGASAVIVIQVLAATDVEPSLSGNLRLVDSETGEIQEIFIDTLAIQRYQDTLIRHQQNWQLACKQVGAIMTTLVAEKVIQNWHLEELVAVEILKVAGCL